MSVFAPTPAGQALEGGDAVYAERAAQQTLEFNLAGSQVRWLNPNSQHGGTITLTRTYQKDDGTYCREFIQTIEASGLEETAYGTACRENTGIWTFLK